MADEESLLLSPSVSDIRRLVSEWPRWSLFLERRATQVAILSRTARYGRHELSSETGVPRCSLKFDISDRVRNAARKKFFAAFRILRKQTSPSLGKKWGVSGKFEKAGEILGGTRTIPVVREAIRAVSKAGNRNGNPIRTFKGCVNPRGASDD